MKECICMWWCNERNNDAQGAVGDYIYILHCAGRYVGFIEGETRKIPYTRELSISFICVIVERSVGKFSVNAYLVVWKMEIRSDTSVYYTFYDQRGLNFFYIVLIYDIPMLNRFYNSIARIMRT